MAGFDLSTEAQQSGLATTTAELDECGIPRPFLCRIEFLRITALFVKEAGIETTGWRRVAASP